MAAVAFAMMAQGHHDAAVNGTRDVENVRYQAERICSEGIRPEEWKQIQNIRLSSRSILHGVNKEEIAWQHRGMMEYYCGRFLARECRDDRPRSQASQHTNDDKWHRQWQFAIDIQVVDTELQSRVLSLLFQQPTQGRRPTQLTYQAWPLLQNTQQGQRASAVSGSVPPENSDIRQHCRRWSPVLSHAPRTAQIRPLRWEKAPKDFPSR